MKKRYTEEHIIEAIKDHEAGVEVDDICSSWHIRWYLIQLAQ